MACAVAPAVRGFGAWLRCVASVRGFGAWQGVVSASIPAAGQVYGAGGYVALVIPFFSDTYLPSQEGTVAQLTDYRDHYVNTTNGRAANFFCVRTSHNGVSLKQLCDPGANGDGTGALTGAVRRHVELFWSDLKRSHFIDAKTRMLSIVMQLKSNHAGVRYRITLVRAAAAALSQAESACTCTCTCTCTCCACMCMHVWTGCGVVPRSHTVLSGLCERVVTCGHTDV